MPAIWSSSERPISVRTVWVDGIRHAILSQDDPLLDVKNRQRLSQGSSVKSKNFLNKQVCNESFHRSTSSLDTCVIKFHVVNSKKDLDTKAVTRRQSAPPVRIANEARNLLNLSINNVLKIPRTSSDDGVISEKNDSRKYLSRGNSLAKSDDSDDFERMGESIIKSVVKFADDIEECKTRENNNPLSERVLHWMDMSGRGHNYRAREGDQRRTTTDHNLVKTKEYLPRECVMRRRNSVIVSRELANQYKLCSSYRKKECHSEDKSRKSENLVYVDTAKKVMIEKADIEPEILQNKSIWLTFGRPQLHIFMPDLNSSEDDMSSQDSFTNDESSNPESIVN